MMISWLRQSAALLLCTCISTWAETAKPDVILEWNAVALQVNVIDHNGPDSHRAHDMRGEE